MRFVARVTLPLLLVSLLASCRRSETERASSGARDASVPPVASLADASADAEPPRGSSADAKTRDASAADAAAEPAPVRSAAGAASFDAGALSCRLAYGPEEQAFVGPATLVARAGELRVVVNESGCPRTFTVPFGPPPAGAPRPPASPSTFASVTAPPCEVAGRWTYCAAPDGTILRTAEGAREGTRIAKALPRTRIAAAALGGDVAVVAYIDARRTTEGDTLQAFAVLDEGAPLRLSDDGAGANVVRLAPRSASPDDGALAVYLDARSAMLPVHARTVARGGAATKSPPAPGLALGPDAVVFVGGPPERNVDVAIASGAGAMFAVVPLAQGTVDFGMAVLRIDDPPKPDVGAVWSLYPNGLDPAPVAATVHPASNAPVEPWVARVRPRDRAATAPRVLELGRLDASGAFRPAGVLVERPMLAHVAVAVDGYGAVWVLYTEAGGAPSSKDADGGARSTAPVTWLERRVCR